MTQKDYNDWVATLNISRHDHLCGGTQLTENEKYFIDQYAKKTILDIGCGTGHRTFPVWISKNFNFCGIEKFINLIDGSRHKASIINEDITSKKIENCFINVFDKLRLNKVERIDVSFLFRGVINGFLDKETQENAWSNFSKLLNKCDFILIDTVSHFDWFRTQDYGYVLKLLDDTPPQYFYSEKEIILLNNKHSLEIHEIKTEYIDNHFKRTHYLLRKK